jgi:hypothetical protein
MRGLEAPGRSTGATGQLADECQVSRISDRFRGMVESGCSDLEYLSDAHVSRIA